MNIIVCVKQVPDTTEIRIDPVTNTLIREGVESILNPFDAYAVEEAVRMKERYGGKVTAICMGPNQAEETLRETVAVGVDDIILLSDRR
ncbi:MAG: electron transfer flavoprotein subunit beta, partial [Candidatus Syntrophosphaera sp.]|nr:electron transfer flavoprotein subunit beta [Candidatus Syntrophosphaera sp.]